MFTIWVKQDSTSIVSSHLVNEQRFGNVGFFLHDTLDYDYGVGVNASSISCFVASLLLVPLFFQPVDVLLYFRWSTQDRVEWTKLMNGEWTAARADKEEGIFGATRRGSVVI